MLEKFFQQAKSAVTPVTEIIFILQRDQHSSQSTRDIFLLWLDQQSSRNVGKTFF